MYAMEFYFKRIWIYVWLFVTIRSSTHFFVMVTIQEKMGICPFHKKFSAKCPISEIIYGNAPILKFNFLKIEFQFKTRFLDNRVIVNMDLKKKILFLELLLKFVKLEFHLNFFKELKFQNFFFFFNFQFAITRLSKNRVLN